MGNVGFEIERRPADGEEAAALIAAYRRGDAQAWLTAWLLGRTRHASGYSETLELLETQHGSLVEL